jgi:hypothetical protein
MNFRVIIKIIKTIGTAEKKRKVNGLKITFLTNLRLTMSFIFIFLNKY